MKRIYQHQKVQAKCSQMQRLQVQCPYLFTKLTCMQNIVVNYLCLFISDNLIYES